MNGFSQKLFRVSFFANMAEIKNLFGAKELY